MALLVVLAMAAALSPSFEHFRAELKTTMPLIDETLEKKSPLRPTIQRGFSIRAIWSILILAPQERESSASKQL